VHWVSNTGTAEWRQMLVKQVFAKAYTGTALLAEELPNHAIVNMAGVTARVTNTGNELRAALNTSLAVKTVEGKTTGWTIAVTTAPMGEGNNNGAVTGANSGAFIDTILQDNHYVDAGAVATGVYTLSGLDRTKKYTIKILGSRAVVASNRVSAFTVTGGVATSAAWTYTATLDCQNNTSTTADFLYVPPTADGKITITVAIYNGSIFGYINCIEIIEV
jgi:hypothetical protein